MQKLELTWIGKGNDPAVEPRILLHDPSKDYGDSDAENMLIHGDNLLTWKALEHEYSGNDKSPPTVYRQIASITGIVRVRYNFLPEYKNHWDLERNGMSD